MFTPLRNLLQRSVRRAGIERVVDATVVHERFREVFRTRWSAYEDAVMLGAFRNGTLRIDVQSPTLAQELRNAEQTLCDEVNRAIGEPIVQRLALRLRTH